MDIDSIKRILKSASLVYGSGDYTSAAILFFKALFMILDGILLEKVGRSPKDHSERFRMIQLDFPDLYTTLDKYYPTCRDTYSTIISKKTCDEVKANVYRIIEKYKIQISD